MGGEKVTASSTTQGCCGGGPDEMPPLCLRAHTLVASLMVTGLFGKKGNLWGCPHKLVFPSTSASGAAHVTPFPKMASYLLSQSQGPAKPPPPRKPLPADPQGRCPSSDLPDPGAGNLPLVIPSRWARKGAENGWAGGMVWGKGTSHLLFSASGTPGLRHHHQG